LLIANVAVCDVLQGDSSESTLQLSEILAEDAEILAEYLDETTLAEPQPSTVKKENEP